MPTRSLSAVTPLLLRARPTDDLLELRDRARAVRRDLPGAKIVLELAAGTYHLRAPLVLEAGDGDTIWRAAPGARAVISGGRVIRGWRSEVHEGQPCWTCELTGGESFTQLWVGGERRHWPRQPAGGQHRFSHLDGQPDSGFAWYRGPSRAGYRVGDLDPNWRNLRDVRLVAYQLWFDTHLRIDRIDDARRIVHFRAPALGSLLDEKELPARYVVENVFEGLREPGTWYHDRSAGRLIYLPLPVECRERTEVVAPQLRDLLVLAGTAEKPVRGVRFENIAFHHADHERAETDVGVVQAAFDVPGAVRLRFAEDCAFVDCEFAHAAQYGLEIEPGCVRPLVSGCHFHDLGAGGVKVCHEELVGRGAHHGPAVPLARPEPIAATITDCHIHHTGLRYPSSVGIYLGNSGHHRVLHNHLHDLPYTAISSGWTWGYADTRTAGVRIEGNHIHHITTGPNRLLSDNAAIYTLGRHPGGRISGNFIHDVDRYGYGGWGIYPDEGSSELVIEGNVVLRTAHAALNMNFGRACLVRGNLFALSGSGHVSLGRQEWHRSFVFEGNTVAPMPGGEWADVIEAAPSRSLWRDNVILGSSDNGFSPGGLLAAQSIGQHLGTRFDDEPPPESLAVLRPGLRIAGSVGSKWEDALRAGPRPSPLRDMLVAPVAEPIVETFLERTAEPSVNKEGVQTTPLRVVYRNLGFAPVRHAVRLSVIGEGRLAPPVEVDRVLGPGESCVFTSTLHAPEGEGEVLVESLPLVGPALPQLLVCDRLASARQLRLPRLGPVANAGEVGDALRDQAWEQVGYARRAHYFARFRVAVCGRALAFHFVVKDARPQRNEAKPYLGSCIEVFAACSDSPRSSGQVFLLPALADLPARALVAQMRAPAESVLIEGELAGGDGAYQVRALVPFEALGLPGDVTSFRLEVAVTAARAQGAVAQRGAWAHATNPFRLSEGMVWVTTS